MQNLLRNTVAYTFWDGFRPYVNPLDIIRKNPYFHIPLKFEGFLSLRWDYRLWGWLYFLHEFFSFYHYLVDFLHEIDDKIDEFLLVHHFDLTHSYQETYVITGKRFSSQNHKILSSLAYNFCEFSAEDLFYGAWLVHTDAYSDRVYGWFDQHSFLNGRIK